MQLQSPQFLQPHVWAPQVLAQGMQLGQARRRLDQADENLEFQQNKWMDQVERYDRLDKFTQEKFAYEKSRDAVTDKQWERSFDLSGTREKRLGEAHEFTQRLLGQAFDTSGLPQWSTQEAEAAAAAMQGAMLSSPYTSPFAGMVPEMVPPNPSRSPTLFGVPTLPSLSVGPGGANLSLRPESSAGTINEWMTEDEYRQKVEEAKAEGSSVSGKVITPGGAVYNKAWYPDRQSTSGPGSLSHSEYEGAQRRITELQGKILDEKYEVRSTTGDEQAAHKALIERMEDEVSRLQRMINNSPQAAADEVRKTEAKMETGYKDLYGE